MPPRTLFHRFRRPRQRKPLLLLVRFALLLSLCTPGSLSAIQTSLPSISIVPQIGHSRWITAVAVTPDGRLALSASADFTLVLWDVATSRELRRLTGHNGAVTSVAIDPNRLEALSGSEDGTLRLWDLETGRELQVFSQGRPLGITRFFRRIRDISARAATDYLKPVYAVALDSRGRFVAGRNSNGTHLWDRRTGEYVSRLEWRSLLDRTDDPKAALAFSPNGRTLVRVDTGDDHVRRWDVESGDSLDALEGHDDGVSSVVFSGDGRLLLSGSSDGTIRVWDIANAAAIETYRHDGPVTAVALSPENRYVIGAAGEEPLYMWDRENGGTRHLFDKLVSEVHALAVDSVGGVVGGAGALIRWNIADGRPSGVLLGSVDLPTSLALSATSLFVGSGRSAWEWDLEQGRVVRRFQSRSSVTAVAVSDAGKRLVVGGMDSSLYVWDTVTGRRVEIMGHRNTVSAVAVSPDGRRALSGSRDGTLRLWRVSDLDNPTGEILDRGGIVRSLAFDPDGRLAVTADWDRVRLWDVVSRDEMGTFRRGDAEEFDYATSAVFSPNGRYVLAGSGLGDVRLWDVKTRMERHKMKDHVGSVNAVIFDHTGRYAYSGGEDQVIRLWNIELESVIQRYEGHAYEIEALVEWPDGRWLASASSDGTVRIWDVETADVVATLIVNQEVTGDAAERWIVIAPDGRFDTNRLEEIENLYWTVSDDPMTALPIEIFMRDYYQPRLLPRILAGEPLPSVRDVSQLNRAQPIVMVNRVEAIPEHPDSVIVTVQANGGSRTIRSGGTEITTASGVYDLRLFRDGHLVARHPAPPEDPVGGRNIVTAQQIEEWRSATRVQGAGGTFTFRVRLPARAGVDTVTFSAYAFNEDRVKSATHRLAHPMRRALRRRRVGVAYVIVIGVANSEDPTFGLTFPPDDVQLLSDSLSRVFARSGLFVDTVTVPLITRPREGAPEALADKGFFSAAVPTKGNIKTVIDLLAHRPIAPDRLREISPDHLARLRGATPDDLVVFTFSGHGVTDSVSGEFYLVPYDIGDADGPTITREQLERSISATELASWFEGVDAGRIILIIGSCYSTAAVEQEGFKPGPMGDRGLGQLAYDKGIQILAASQSEATEAAGHGLLAYALALDGLAASAAGGGPRTFTQLLMYARDQIPRINREWRQSESEVMQEAALFDFKRQQLNIELRPAPPGAGSINN